VFSGFSLGDAVLLLCGHRLVIVVQKSCVVLALLSEGNQGDAQACCVTPCVVVKDSHLVLLCSGTNLSYIQH